jgi:hypothetical protein
MDNFQSDVNIYQAPSLETMFDVNVMEIEEEPQQFIPLSLSGHNENLAESLPRSTLERIASELIEDIEEDVQSRKEWEQNIANAMDYVGIKIEENIAFPFPNASGSYSSIIKQNLVEFMAVASTELLPVEGPAKVLIMGDVTDEIEAQAQRTEDFFNLFLTDICREYYPDTKQMLLWVNLIGTCFKKTYFDQQLQRPTSLFLMPQNFIVNYGTTNLEKCWRMTEVLSLNRMEVKNRENKGTFITSDVTADDTVDASIIQTTLDKVQGVTNTSTDNKTDYTFYECHTYLDLEDMEDIHLNDEEEDHKGEKPFKPYCITINKKNSKIVAITRDWEEDDEDFNRIEYYTKYGYSQGLGFYDFGAAQLIYGEAKAATALLRQTLDGQTLNNFPGGLRVKGMRLEDNNLSMGPCEWKEIDTAGLPIGQAIMAMPYKEPSPQINVLRNEIENSAARIMGAVNTQIPDFNPNAPVGTTLALLERMQQVQSTVIRNLRDAMSQEFRKFYKLFAKVLPEEPYSFDRKGGSTAISRSDFIDQISMVPVADPHITSNMQRLLRGQTVIDLSNQSPDLYDRYEAQKIYLQAAKFADSEIDRLLPDKNKILPLDPVTENQNLITGKAVKAGIEQDHTAHLTVHEFMMQDPAIQPQVAAATMAHIAEHKAFQFLINIQQMTGMQIPAKPEEVPLEVQNQIAMMAADAISKQQQQNQENAPPPLIDPAAVMLEKVKVEDKSVEKRAEASELEAQVKTFEAQLDYDAKMKALELKDKELDLKAESGKI